MTVSYNKIRDLGPDEKRRTLIFSSRAHALVYRGLRFVAHRSCAWVSHAVTLQGKKRDCSQSITGPTKGFYVHFHVWYTLKSIM